MDDWQLLQNYGHGQNEAAFGQLVERHIGLVYSSALRQVNQPQLAQEITQSVFILLARKSRTLSRSVVLAGWLFRTTRFVASRAMRSELRRQRREQEAFAMQNTDSCDDSWKRIAPLLEEGLETLGSADRDALLLRFFEHKNHREVGEAMGLSEEAARKRVERAVDKLRNHFANRGLKYTSAALTVALMANAAQAVPVNLAASVTAAVISTGAEAATLPAMVKETLAALRSARLKVAASLLGVGVIVGTAVSLMYITPRHASPPPTSSDQQSQSTAVAKKPAARKVATSAFSGSTASASAMSQTETFRFQLVAQDTGEPIPNAKLLINTVVGGNWTQRDDLTTDWTGICDVLLTNGVMRLDISVVAQGWSSKFVTWKDEPLPSGYVMQVQRLNESVGGIVQDRRGNPVPGVEIWCRCGNTTDYASRETPRERAGIFQEAVVAVSDSNGHWSCSVMGSNGPALSLSTKHPDFAEASVKFNAEKTSVTVLLQAITLTGTILDETGRPIANATIAHDPFSSSPLTSTSDSNGQFSFHHLSRESFDFIVRADGFAPEYGKLDIDDEVSPLTVTLHPGAVLKLRVVDDEGIPVPDASVLTEQWGDIRYMLKWEAKSGPDGRIEWKSAPGDKKLELCARKDGWCYTRSVYVTADDAEHAIILERALPVPVYVIDADTGKPMAEFKACAGYGEGDAEWVWERLYTQKGVDGFAKVTFTESKHPWRLRVEAEGYQPTISEPVVAGLSLPLELKMKRTTTARQ